MRQSLRITPSGNTVGASTIGASCGTHHCQDGRDGFQTRTRWYDNFFEVLGKRCANRTRSKGEISPVCASCTMEGGGVSMTPLSFAAVVKARCAESALQQGSHVPFSTVRACFGESDGPWGVSICSEDLACLRLQHRTATHASENTIDQTRFRNG